MSEFFLKIVNMSISASWLVLAVLLLRLVLKKAPKWVSVLLWGFVAVRLICPFSFESVLSLIPSAETISPEIMMDPTPEVHTGIPSLNSVINPIVTESFAPEGMVSMNPLQLWIPLAAMVWIAGIAVMLIYTAVSYILLRRKVATAVRLKNNIFQSENVDSPFVLGIIKPKIYLPFRMDNQTLDYVIAHEESHIRRKDHWWKPLGFVLLAIHWFNPLMWIGYILLCRDIELACDEKVIMEMDNENKANYTEALVACSINRRRIAACPLAFGEVGVKERVKSVMNYRKPAFWIILAAIVSCLVVAVCFLTDPISNTLNNIEHNNFNAVTQENTTVLVSDGETHTYAGAVERKKMQELYNIRISRKEISLNRSDDRDKTNSLYLNLSSQEKQEILTSYAPGIWVHFNADFTEVWVEDGVKPTLSYKVLKPEKAQSVYLSFTNKTTDNEPIETINGGLKTYYKNADGTWQWNDRTYQYRLEITGRMPNAAVDSTFVYLSNLKSISFSRAWKAAGFSSSTEDYFSPEEAVLVDWISGDNNSGTVEGVNDYVIKTDRLNGAIAEAILSHHKSGKPDGLLNTESHMILVNEVVSGTPLAGQTNHVREVTVYVHYLNMRFHVQGDRPEEHDGIYGQAAITFTIDDNGIYNLKHFVKPESSVDSGAEYSAELKNKFVAASEDIAENEEKYGKQLLDGCWKNATDYVEHIKNQASAQPGGMVSTPLIDSIAYDIDSDGKDEMCTLTHGPTSGLFSFCFYASPLEATAAGAKYSETYVLAGSYDLSFDIPENGELRIKGVSTDDSKEVVYFDIEVNEGRIVLQCEEEKLLLKNIGQI